MRSPLSFRVINLPNLLELSFFIVLALPNDSRIGSHCKIFIDTNTYFKLHFCLHLILRLRFINTLHLVAAVRYCF